jgi:branched-chain amino acid transport system ATP-binding protein
MSNFNQRNCLDGGIIKDLNANEGISVLLVEQNALAALFAASHGCMMENGRGVFYSPASSLANNEDI